jgi:hypothetical protein
MQLCYAARGNFRRGNVKDSLERNLKHTEDRRFTQNMRYSIRENFARVVRIHASGEFYSVEYTQDWLKIIEQHPYVTFFAYTRSWRNEEVLAVLRQMAKLPNMRLWFSCDQETGAPPRVAGVRRAYMMINDSDAPKFKVDLVFRDHAKTIMKWVGTALVCPYENGTTKTACSRCRLCFKPDAIPRRNR